MESDLPALSFADFNSVMLVIIGVCANGAVALITLILVLILAWNYLKPVSYTHLDVYKRQPMGMAKMPTSVMAQPM